MRTGASWGVVEPTRSSSTSTAWVVFGIVALAVVAAVGVVRYQRTQRRAETAGPRAPAGDLPPPATPKVPPGGGPKQPSPAGSGPAVFLCYRRADSADVAGRIYQQLEARFGRERLFKDVDAIALGRDFREAIAEAMSTSAVLLALIGPAWLTEEKTSGHRRIDDPRDHVRAEIEAALARNIPVIPVLVRGAQVPEEHDLPESLGALAYRNGVEVRADPDFYNDMDRLTRAITTYLGL